MSEILEFPRDEGDEQPVVYCIVGAYYEGGEPATRGHPGCPDFVDFEAVYRKDDPLKYNLFPDDRAPSLTWETLDQYQFHHAILQFLWEHFGDECADKFAAEVDYAYDSRRDRELDQAPI